MSQFKKHTIAQSVAKKTGNSNTVVEDEYTIPNGKTLTLDRLTGGTEYSTKETRIELVDRGGSDTIIAVGYGQSFDFYLGEDFIGDGTKKIVIRLVNGDTSGALHMFARWRAFERDTANG